MGFRADLYPAGEREFYDKGLFYIFTFFSVLHLQQVGLVLTDIDVE